MQYKSIYKDDGGDEHLEDVEMGLVDFAMNGSHSITVTVSSNHLRKNKPGHGLDLNTIPNRQLVISLNGGIELTISLSEIKKFKEGKLLICEDSMSNNGRTDATNIRRKSVHIII